MLAQPPGSLNERLKVTEQGEVIFARYADVTLAQIRLARNAERNQIASLESQMLGLVTEVERTYWQLWQAYYDILILERLRERGQASSERMSVMPPA